MKKTQMLPLAAMISGLLVGCGAGSSGGSGGSGGGSTPTDYVSLQFVQKVTSTTVPNGCTVFSENTSVIPAQYTYAKLAADVRVVAHSADGLLDVDLSYTPSSKGIVKIDKLKLEDGGYISIIDSPSEQDPFYRVLSIQKEYLESQLIQINRNQGNVGCYTSGDDITMSSGDIAVFTNNAPADSFQYLSSQLDSGVINSNLFKATANAGEPVLVKGFLSGVLSSYGHASHVGSTQVSVTLEPLDTTFSWTDGIFNGAGSGLDFLEINLAKGNYINQWVEPNVATVEAFNYTSLESDWYYVAGGKYENWNFSMVDALQSSLNVDIPSSLTITDLAPTVTNASSKGVVSTAGVLSMGDIVIRAKYMQSFGSGPTLETLEHVILAKPKNGETIVPDLNFNNLSAVSPTTLKTELIAVDGLTEPQIQNIFKQNEGSDSVALVIPPSDVEASEYLLKTTTYTKVTREM